MYYTLKYLVLSAIWMISILWSINLPGQNYIWSNWTVEDGLSSNDATDILQDSDGFIWTATEHGLNKFDGYTFTNYRYHPGDTTSIGANYINSICEDEHENIWVNLGVGVVSKFDKRLKKFENYFFPERETYIYQMRFVNGVGICIATSNGLFTVDDGSRKMALLTHQNEEDEMPVYRIFSASNDRLYLSTKGGFEIVDLSTNSMKPVYFVGESGKERFTHFVNRLYEELDGVIWIQTSYGSLCQSKDGIHFKKSRSGSGVSNSRPLDPLFFDEGKNNAMHFFSNSRELLSYDRNTESWAQITDGSEGAVFAIGDRNHHVWLFTRENKVLKWDGHTLKTVVDLDGELNYWEIKDIHVDELNGVWLACSRKGIWRIYERQWPIQHVTNRPGGDEMNFETTALLMGEPTFMWLGTHGQLFKYHLESEVLEPMFAGSYEDNPLAGFRVNDLAKSKSNDLWVAYSRGLLIIDPTEESHKNLKRDTTAGKNVDFGYVRCMLPDDSGRMWLGGAQGLFMHDPNRNVFHHFQASEADHSIKRNSIQCIHQVNETDFLIGYVKDGVDLMTFDSINNTISCQKVTYEKADAEQYDLMTANTFYHSDGDYWVGTYSRGLLKLDLDNLRLNHLNVDFPIIPNVKGIQKGENGNLWVSSIDGLRSVNPSDGTYYRFSRASGLISNQFRIKCAIQDDAGNMYFGSSKGLNKIQPVNWNVRDSLPSPIITDFKKYDEHVPLEGSLNEPETVALEYEDNFITINFVSPTYDNPRDIEYAYQLVGFDKKWRLSEGQRSATYTNLAPGEYMFKVQAGSKGGSLNSPTRQLKIIVAPPFWRSPWFALLVFGSLSFIVWVVYSLRQQAHLNRLKIVAEVRKKAADDFHDELGHRLTKIVLFVESLMLTRDTFPERSVHLLRKIQDNANALFYSTKDFIWAMNPSKNSALELFIHLRDFGTELFEDTPVDFSVEGLKEEYKDYLLDMDWKRQLVMIFKEAMNNALKHSDCTRVVLKIIKSDKHLKVVVIDDGKGFTLNGAKFGYGLGSIRNRSEKIGGQLEINSEIGRGTEVVIKI